MAENIVEMRGIVKTFSGVTVLDSVDFHLERGEIHALMGENGAGKSTLIKVMTGMYRADGGEIFLEGKPVVPTTVFQMQSAGISTIYQEINLIPNMSVCQNMTLVREKRGFLGRIDWKEARQRTRDALAGLGLSIDVDKPLCSYSTAVQQMVAIARALSFDCKAVVMDEPTSSLNETEIASLFSLVRGLRDKGISFVFVSHKLREVFDLCDSVTILRDGKLIGRHPLAELDHASLVSKMIGRDAGNVLRAKRAPRTAQPAETFCELSGISHGQKVRGISFGIARGEILGLAGLLGSGRTETLRLLFGVDHPDAGIISIDNRETRIHDPGYAVKLHFGFCPEDRKADGIIPNMSVADNIAMANMPAISRHGIVSASRKNSLALDYIAKLRIKASSARQPIRTMSGGNQQKAILSRWLATSPRLLLLDEPTRGIDVGARSEILELIRTLAADGMSVLVVSSEWDELLQICDRILVYRDGVNIAELTGEAMSEDAIVAAIAGGETCKQ